MKKRQSSALGHHMANMATLWAQQCITKDVKTCTFPPPQANASWTLWSFPPHNSPIPQFLSTDRLIMASNDMTNALKNPHPAFPLAQVGDETIAALTQLAEIFKNNFQKVEAPELSNVPIKAAENKRPVVMA
jgi:hypothetical protein